MKRRKHAHSALTASTTAAPRIDIKRRQTVLAAALACAIPSLAFAAVEPFAPAPEATAGDAEVGSAIAFVQARYIQKQPVVYQPVSLLQRQFRLGYGKALALARKMERIGFWTIHEPQLQQREARLNATFSPDCAYLAG